MSTEADESAATAPTSGEGAAGAEGQERPRATVPAPAGASALGAGARDAEPPAEAGDDTGDGSEPEAEAGPVADPAGRRRRLLVLGVLAAVVYLFDLATKTWVVRSLEGREPIEVIPGLLRFQALRNPGAAFGIGEAYTVFFTLVATVVLVVIIRLARKLYSTPWAVGLGLLLGGALGNLTDRVFRSPGLFQGHVVDFIAPTNFAVFNIADSAIVCGGILIVLLSFRGSAPDGTTAKD
ncbi:signal peptidase II [Allostreptomyces psammosilenae]|uniref:signal peptidase II n=1 Tax=Allostreptomyces psammosilenae TaxID=1892865 RepID=UPI0035E4507A